jgi:hypothetical protein
LRAGRRSAQLVDAAGGALFILKHMHDLSDEVLCARWLENPLYLTYRAEKAGYHPQLIRAGHQVNDGIGARVARQCVRMMLRRDGARGPVTILGLSFKENVRDIRNSKVMDIVRELESFYSVLRFRYTTRWRCPKKQSANTGCGYCRARLCRQPRRSSLGSRTTASSRRAGG